MSRAFNFCAGPATLPEPVLKQAQEEMLDWRGTGMSVMEMSHRSDEFVAIAEEAERDLRELAEIPEDYAVLFMQGGASSQFSTIPLNLLGDKTSADYVNTGIWSKKAIAEARRYGDVNVVASSEDSGFTTVPDPSGWRTRPDAAYLHYTPNETIGGLEFDFVPDSGDVPLVADMSSTILSRPLDVTRYGLIYAGAQKNIGPSGLVVVILRKDLLGKARKETPTMMNYQVIADNGSMYNTPATYSWYLAGLVFKWLKAQGGLEAMAERNERKARKLYRFIDDNDFYANPIEPRFRSRMNVPFTLADEALNRAFLEGAEARGLLNLKGHRSVGGMRASLYNAMPEAGVDALIDYMAEFAKEHG
ncbi:3-phosphoserine/phosphohydroxythreonine transaminase [Marinobacter lutaoensis]|jgi:phosphoserine aminotransferase|uniref:Phosphoserine aminotransferase n=1 Tax=Marinobacter lutaoensis TaxID=135739 RepID=A0A1V2DT83_9GAMM|nr:3-phosphoserine/phosphohydroxythreonine transaminase [Marinobacter lutaoensis]MBE01776.1 3-phosphoserine/phosphohydroxythreonine transaminase [Marinobacter sp.]MBI42046.1 3-phosphoserine/phosphohydroxythreonine transaminase [Oceanospirillales bacterium]NVD36204.1 3-phosphoserine/phosphohydroxythreonine transaminase [Marinobacter lutaoensis]ONF43918.1 phosphoserine transaminase [Marinobacter lutaoensis]|tara:strand:+ start:5847 stop:6929 length:1083 start_codon:yes stop_codon:yes gene_type:complete